MIGLATGGVVYYGGSLAFDGTILPGTLVLFVAYLKNLYKPVEKFADMMLEVATAQVAGARLLELVECDMVMQDTPDAVPAPRLTGRVEFRQVSFGYQQDSDVLQHLSFVAAARRPGCTRRPQRGWEIDPPQFAAAFLRSPARTHPDRRP